ncbi:MAG: FtsX-like permease family protein [Acutalibacteraceae bacterium]
MRSLFFPRLAFQNIIKNRRFYFPYFITCLFSVLMFYNLMFITNNKGLSEMRGGEEVQAYLGLGKWVVAIFACIFLFYTNSFLVKSRKKELGLYNILGMSKSNLAHMLLWESLYTALFTLAAGLGLGIILSKLLLLLLCYILGFEIPITFGVSPASVLTTLLLFSAIFLVTLCYNLFCIRLTRPVELLKGGNVGEKEPKANFVSAILGFLSLGAGYSIALLVEDPVSAAVWFFAAVLLVIFGTYLIFISGSIAVLKLLRKNKRYYYKPKNFTAVSGMLYRMKQNAAGLASICILSTMVLVMISSTVCLNFGVEDILKKRVPNDITVIYVSEDGQDSADAVFNAAEGAINDSGLEITNRRRFDLLDFITVRRENDFSLYTPGENVSALKACAIAAVPQDSYNGFAKKTADLKDGEALGIFSDGESLPDKITVAGVSLTLSPAEKMPASAELSTYSTPVLYLVVNDGEFERLNQTQMEHGGENASRLKCETGFDIRGTAEEKIACYNRVDAALRERTDAYTRVQSRDLSRGEFNASYGGLFFIGIFLGILFIGFTALIIYYKQISEGFEDRRRYQIMQKVGMSEKEVKRSINSQVLKVFFLPLAAAAVHLAFAYKIIRNILLLFGMTNGGLFIACIAGTVALFAAVYFLIYYLTAKVYFKIVNA